MPERTASRPAGGTRCGCLLGLLLCLLLTSIPLGASLPPGRWPLKEYGSDQGLANETPLAMIQDPQGFLWVGTEHGVFRYDGIRFRAFLAPDGKPLAEARVFAWAHGSVWVGAPQGLFRVEGDRLVAFSLPPGAGGVASLATPARDGLWCASNLGPLRITATGKGEVLPNWPGGPCSAVAVGREGSGMLACRTLAGQTQTEVWRHGQGIWSLVGALPQQGLQNFNALLEDRSGRIWVRSGQNVMLRAADGGDFHLFPGGALTSAYPRLVEDDEGTLWLPFDQGLAVVNARGERTLITDKIRPLTYVASVFFDREGNLWICSTGLFRRQARGILTLHGREDHLPSTLVWYLHPDDQGNLWAGTGDGACRALGGRWLADPVTAGAMIRTVTTGPGGTLLMAGREPRLYQHHRRTGVTTVHPIAQPSPLGRIFRVRMDRQSRIWLATETAGLVEAIPRGTGFTFQEAGGHPGLVRSRISDLDEDAQGRFFAATNRGLGIREGTTWTFLSQAQGLRRDHVAYVRVLANQDILVAYFDYVAPSRLHRRPDGSWQVDHLDPAVFPSEKIYAMAEDLQGRLWFGTDRGIAILGQGLADWITRSDGLPSNDFNAQAAWVSPSGEVFFGTGSGLIQIDATRYLGPPPPPRAHLAHLAWGEGPRLHPPDQLAFPSRGTAFTAELGALDYINEARLCFELRLHGLEPDWRLTRSHEVSYAALPPGTYRLDVRARYDRGAPGPIRSLSLTVLPAWWQTWWFRGFLVLLGAGLVTALAAWRMRWLRAKNRLLERLVAARTREVVQAKDQAERASAFKSIFIATTSHELRTPLNAILGFLRLLENEALRPLERRRMLRIVGGAAEALLQLVNDLLDLGRIEAGKLALEPVPMNLREVLEGALQLLGKRAEEKGILLLCEVDPRVPAQHRGDPHRLRQMVVNLLGNAVKFTRQGHVRVIAEPLDEAGGLRITIEDTGEGIPAEVLPRLFQPYAQAESSAKRQGTGLGLSITRHLAENMGGQAGAESTVGQGSRFWFTVHLEVLEPPPTDRPLEGLAARIAVSAEALRQNLSHHLSRMGAVLAEPAVLCITDAPASAQSHEEILLVTGTEPPGNVPSHWKTLSLPFGESGFLRALADARETTQEATWHTLEGKVLVADDNEANRQLMEALLRQFGVTFTLAEDGLQAVAACTREHYDVVLLDRNMPHLDGFETLTRLKSLGPQAPGTIVLFSASVTPEAVEAAMTLGFDTYLPKPVDSEALYRLLQKTLNAEAPPPAPLRPTQPTTTHQVLDRMRLESLLPLLGGLSGLQEFVQAFQQDAVERLERMDAALATLDRHTLERDAHDLKTNAGNVGLQVLAATALALERSAGEAPTQALAAQVAAIQTAHHQGNTVLEAVMTQLALRR